MKEYDCYIVTSDHDNGTKDRYQNITDGWNDRGNSRVLYLPDKEYFSVKRLDSVVKEIHPDIIYLQSLFQDLALLGLIVAKRNKIKVILAPRGELCGGAFKKKYKKIPYILALRITGLIKNAHFQSTSDEETEAINRYLKVPYERIHYLTNIPSIPKKEYTHPPKIQGEARLVFISRIHRKKNLTFALNCIRDIKGKIQYDIYGPIEDKEYWAECQNIIKELPDNIKVEYKGLLDHDEVHEAFSQYDAFLFPTLSENYGHVIAESLVVGTPVIISDQTPWRNLKEAGAGWDIQLDDNQAFIQAINTILISTNDDTKASQTSVKDFARSKMKLDELMEKYKTTFNALIL